MNFLINLGNVGKKNMNKINEEICAVICSWLFINLIPFFIGLLMVSSSLSNYRCEKPLNKIEYIFPGFQLGCYLGKPF